MNDALLLLVGMHVLGDYYLQWNTLAEPKLHSCPALFLHGIMYALPFFALFALTAWYIPVSLIVSHLLIDSIGLLKVSKKLNPAIRFVADQTVHIALLVVASTLIEFNLEANQHHILSIVVLLLCVLKPVSVLFTQLFDRFRPQPTSDGLAGAGKVIGYLERLLITVLLIVGQFGVIGWVIAAKTLARGKQLNESQQFCEYFLVGTLASILSAIMLYLLFYR